MMPNLMNYKEKMRKLLLRKDFSTASEVSSRALASCITISDDFTITDRVDSTHLYNFIVRLEAMTNSNISASVVSANAIKIAVMESFISRVRSFDYDDNFLVNVLNLQMKFINHGYKLSLSNLPLSKGILKSLIDNVKYSVAKSLYESKDTIAQSVDVLIRTLDSLTHIFKINDISESVTAIQPESLLPNLNKLSDDEFEEFLSELNDSTKSLVVFENAELSYLIDNFINYIQSFDINIELD
jgi:hypothetical protein